MKTLLTVLRAFILFPVVYAGVGEDPNVTPAAKNRRKEVTAPEPAANRYTHLP